MSKEDFSGKVSKMLPAIIRETTRRQMSVFMKSSLTISQMVILDYLMENEICKMSDLAKVLNLTMSAVTAIVDKMIRTDLLKRERSNEDRRVVRIMLLKKGRELAVQVKKARSNSVKEMFSTLTDAEKREYLRILHKIYNNLKGK